MIRQILSFVFLFFALVSFSYNFIIYDLGTANKLSQIEKKPLLIYFASPECIYCKKFESEVLPDKTFQNILRAGYIFVKIIPDNKPTEFLGEKYTNRELFAAFGVRGTPTFVFWNNGQGITNIPGYMPKGDFVKALRYILRFIYDHIEISFKQYSKTTDEFYGKPLIVKISKEEGDFIVKNDKNAIFISEIPEKFDKFALYLTESKQIANKLIEKGAIRVLLIRK